VRVSYITAMRNAREGLRKHEGKDLHVDWKVIANLSGCGMDSFAGYRAVEDL